MGKFDYEEWFESADIGSMPVNIVAFLIADLYRKFFEVCGLAALALRLVRDLIVDVRLHSKLDHRSVRSVRDGRSGPERMPLESVLASCGLPGFILTTTREFILKLLW